MSSKYAILIEMIYTERSTKQSESMNTYAFKVRTTANKLEIKEAVEKAFKVKVDTVRTLRMHPKLKVDRNRGIRGKTRNFKKAMVKLSKGYSIEVA